MLLDAVADFVRHAGPRGEVAVARAVDEDLAAHREAARLRLDEHRVDLVVGREHGADAERMEQNVDLGFGEQLVGRDLERRDVVGLREDLIADREVRLVQAVHRAQAIEDVVRDSVHDLLVLAVHDGVQPAESAQARGRACAAEEAVALDQERRAAAASGRERGGDAGRAAAEHDDLVLAEQRGLARGLDDLGMAHRESRSVVPEFL